MPCQKNKCNFALRTTRKSNASIKPCQYRTNKTKRYEETNPCSSPAAPRPHSANTGSQETENQHPTATHLPAPRQGKRVAYFGDSITDPNIKASKVKYWGFLQQWLGITPYVYGVSGRQWNDILRQADKLKAEHGDDFDAILIFMGTNDFNNGVPVGEWYTETFDSVKVARHKPGEMVQRRHRHFAMDKNTLKGRINIAMSKLKQMYPTKQIVVMTPVHRAYFCSGEKNIQPDEMYENARGVFFDEYVKAVKEVGNVWAVPVIDLNALSGLFPSLRCGRSALQQARHRPSPPQRSGS